MEMTEKNMWNYTKALKQKQTSNHIMRSLSNSWSKNIYDPKIIYLSQEIITHIIACIKINPL